MTKREPIAERIAELKARMDGAMSVAKLTVILFDLLTLLEEVTADEEQRPR